ncbi:solute carrier family 7 member 13-like isoform X2 [Acinonyx jubatus]|uniref:Solute carrier family 7 member 13-like isoform X2 n=1 Tax=Acinonyx jubatus TaxID=32536 RepID=A0A6J1ZRQ7_ACIJB|nr:solute carrier family 7 member 13-like isoform X2 [Acinonyx jubatus]
MQLLRSIGFFHGNILLFCVTTGAGIFVSPKGVLKYSSLNIAVSLSIWAACAVLTIISALSLAELGTTFPRSGAPYYFLKRSLGSSVAFLSLWIKFFIYPLGIATQSLIISTYIIQPFYTRCPAPELPKKCLALAILWSLGLLNTRGVLTVAWFQTISVLMKITILCFISLTGIVLLGTGKKENVAKFENSFDAELPGASQIAEALLQGLFAYSGTSILINIAGEIKNPGENIPKALITVLPMVAVVYILVNISYLAVLTPQEIISADAVAVTWMDKVRLPFIFGSIAISLFLILTPMIHSPKVEYIYGFIFIFSGLLGYRLHVHLNQRSVCFDKITCYLQLLFNVSPPEDQDEGISTGKKHLEEIFL